MKTFKICASMLFLQMIGLVSLCFGAEGIRFDAPSVAIKEDGVAVEFNYEREKWTKIKEINFYVRRNGKELYLATPSSLQLTDKIMASEHGTLKFTLPVSYVPAGDYELVAKPVLLMGESNHVLKSADRRGRSIIEVANYKGTNYELKCKIAGDVIAPFVRAQDGVTQASTTWKFYFSPISDKPMLEIKAFMKSGPWEGKSKLLGASGERVNIGKDGWHALMMRCQGNTLEVEIDGKKVTAKDEQNMYPQGYLGFRGG